jgi:hypothetical protein
MRRTLLVIVAMATHFSIYAQTNCAQTLRLAQSVYDQGRLHELPPLLETCLHNGFTQQEKVSAYKLLALTYIYLEEPQKADEAMLALLRTDHEFQVNNAVDPAEFVALYNTFRTNPIYRLGGRVGTIVSQPTVINAEYANEGTSQYKYKFGLTASIVGEIPLTGFLNDLTFNPELSFKINSFSGENRDAADTLVTTVNETQSWIALPLLLQYNIFQPADQAKRKLRMLYVAAGVSPEYLISARQKLESLRKTNSPVDERSVEIGNQRNAFNLGAVVAAGYKRKFGKGYLTAELRYQFGLMPLLEKSDQYENQTIVLDYKWVDAIYRMNSASFSLGYVLNQYNPKKKSSK